MRMKLINYHLGIYRRMYLLCTDNYTLLQLMWNWQYISHSNLHNFNSEFDQLWLFGTRHAMPASTQQVSRHRIAMPMITVLTLDQSHPFSHGVLNGGGFLFKYKNEKGKYFPQWLSDPDIVISMDGSQPLKNIPSLGGLSCHRKDNVCSK